MKTQVLLSVFTALGASICCITPLLAVAAVTGSAAASFNWVEPFRPYLASISVSILSFAWFQMLRTKGADECGCEPKKTFLQSKKFLGLITMVSLLLITFPGYSKFLLKPNAAVQIQDTKKHIEFAVKGMTCTSCEFHIEGEVNKLLGVSFVSASYEKGSVIVEFDEKLTDKEKVIAAINATGYKVEGYPSSALLGKENCTVSSCQIPIGELPKEKNKNLIALKDISQIQKSFNNQTGKTKFVAILSSTCKWCLHGAESVKKAIIEKKTKNDVSVFIVWTNMLQSDGENTAYQAASLFQDKNIVQFFDAENKFGDIAAKAINPDGDQAWDIYMFFDKDAQWNTSLPRPFDYAHQLGATRTWVDRSKYHCGSKLTDRLNEIINSL